MAYRKRLPLYIGMDIKPRRLAVASTLPVVDAVAHVRHELFSGPATRPGKPEAPKSLLRTIAWNGTLQRRLVLFQQELKYVIDDFVQIRTVPAAISQDINQRQK